jgi:hypothetical protein
MYWPALFILEYISVFFFMCAKEIHVDDPVKNMVFLV